MASRLYAEQANRGMAGQFSNFMANPLQFLMQQRINIPQEYANDPRAAVQYLLNSGQMTQQQFEQLRMRAAQMGVKV